MAAGTSRTETCKHGNQAPKYILRDLPQSQGGEGRHGCVVCAYEAGSRKGFSEPPVTQPVRLRQTDY